MSDGSAVIGAPAAGETAAVGEGDPVMEDNIADW